ncbi:ABC transporter permease [Halosimplex rubrum]|nr:ABC transporter permease [Halosimplex rubrum]
MTRTDDTTAESDRAETTSAASPRSDGGQRTASPLDALGETSDHTVENTRRDRLETLYRYYVYTPVSVLWDDWRARIGCALILFYLAMGILGPVVVEPTTVMDGEPLLGPFESWEHPLGTDNTGSDLLSLAVYSTAPILKMMTAGGLFTVTVGTLFGTVAGYKGGLVDTLLSTVTDVFINLPGLPLVIVLAAIFSPKSPWLIGLLLSVASWAGLARSIRSQVLTIREESYAEASRAMGIPTSAIITKDVLPHLMTYISVNLVHASRNVIFGAVGLYFIGVLPFSDPNWGVTMNLAYQYGAHYRMEAVHWLIVPIVSVTGLSMGMILLSQSLDRVFNPRVRASHAETAEEVSAEEVDETDTSASSWF